MSSAAPLSVRSIRPRSSGRLAVLMSLTAALAVLATGTAGTEALAQELIVEVSPHQARLMYGGTVQFTVEARDGGGDPVEGNVTWEVIPDRLGAITTEGLFTAGGIGRGIVRATVVAGPLSGVGHAMLRVSPVSEPTPVVLVEPRRAELSPGENARFRARVTDPNTGEELSLPVDWQVIPKGLGSVGPDGSFLAANRAGTGHVVARVRRGDSQGLGEARVVVGQAGPSDLIVKVTPRRTLLLPGETRRFEAVLLGAEGLDPAPAIEWSALPPDLGTMRSDGTLVAGTSAVDGRVVASVGTRDGVSRGYANVAVREGQPYRLAVQIHPREAVVIPGSEVHFEATVLGPDGEITQADVKWEVRPPTLGSISPRGVFTAARSPVGEGEVAGPRRVGEVIATAQYGGNTAQGRARLALEERPVRPVWLRVRPARTKLRSGEQVQFFAELAGGGDPREVDVRWSVRPEELGTITPDGLFTATERPGDPTDPASYTREGIVVAEARLTGGRTIRGNALVAIRLLREPEVRIEPSSVSLRAGDSRRFRVLVNGTESQLLGARVIWQVKPPELGVIDPGGELRVSSDIARTTLGRVGAEVHLGGNQIYHAAATVTISPASRAPRRETGP